jgi:hypothetical protein
VNFSHIYFFTFWRFFFAQHRRLQNSGKMCDTLNLPSTNPPYIFVHMKCWNEIPKKQVLLTTCSKNLWGNGITDPRKKTNFRTVSVYGYRLKSSQQFLTTTSYAATTYYLLKREVPFRQFYVIRFRWISEQFLAVSKASFAQKWNNFHYEEKKLNCIILYVHIRIKSTPSALASWSM